MFNVVIRKAKKEEIPRINELFIQMVKHVNDKNKALGIEVDETLFQNGYDEGYLDKFFIDDQKVICVADLEGEVIGYISCEGYKTDAETSYLYLDDFCVDAKYRGNGIGSKLVEDSSIIASDMGLINLKLHVDENNNDAIKFYANLGFESINSENGRIEMQKPVLNQKVKF